MKEAGAAGPRGSVSHRAVWNPNSQGASVVAKVRFHKITEILPSDIRD